MEGWVHICYMVSLGFGHYSAGSSPALVAEIIRLVLGRHPVIRAAQGSKNSCSFPKAVLSLS